MILNDLIKEDHSEPSLKESTSLESTLKNIVNNSTHIIQVYETLKSMAQKWVHNTGSLKGFHRNAAGVGARWFDQFYFNKLQKELYDLSHQAPRHAAPLVQYLRYASTGSSLSFKDISDELPTILQQLGSKIQSPELERFADIWSQRRDNYYAFLEELLNDEEDEPQSTDKPKDNIIGQQTSQIEKIVNDVLASLPKNVAGDIRNAIARSGNKLTALKQELDKRGISLSESQGHSTNEAAAWQKSSGKNKNGGLNQKGVDSYRREHPGSKLQTAVTKKPSELKAGSKDAKRRKSFCARMKGMKKHNTGSKTAHDPDSRINKSLRKWNCESIEEMAQLLVTAEKMLAEAKQKQRLDDKCWKGYRKQGTKMKGDTRVNNCVKIGEAWEAEMAKVISILESKSDFRYQVVCDGYDKGKFVTKNDAIFSGQYMIYYGEEDYKHIEVKDLKEKKVIWKWDGKK